MGCRYACKEVMPERPERTPGVPIQTFFPMLRTVRALRSCSGSKHNKDCPFKCCCYTVAAATASYAVFAARTG